MIKSKNETWGAFFLELLILILVVLFIRFYIFQFFRVSGPSMCPTLNVINDICRGERGGNPKGEFIFVNEILYQFTNPKRGETVVFRPPNKRVYYVKRIIGVGGDKVTIEDDGLVYLENLSDGISKIQLPEELYLSDKNLGMTHVRASKKEFIIPEDEYLLFGDNRQHSLDARKCFENVGCTRNTTAFLTKKNIVGRAEFVIWPFWTIRFLDNKPFHSIFYTSAPVIK